MKELIIGKNEANQRLDKLVTKSLPDAGKGFIYKMIRKKNITLNDKRCAGNEILCEGDRVQIWLSEDTLLKFSNSESYVTLSEDLEIVYEDTDIIVFNKPAGMLSQKARPSDVSVNDMLISYLLKSGQLSERDLQTFKPSICNRLDRNTSGLIICGKSLKGLQSMAVLLRERTVHKDYIAIVEGELRTQGVLKGHLKKDKKENIVSLSDEGDYIETEYKPIWTDGVRTVIMVRLITGKTHQIRMHLASAGHPLIGDRKYGSGKGAGRQMLHAYRITFPDGSSYTSRIPEDMKWVHGNPGAFEDLPSRI
ncbi:MAG: RluA family pseudouridine synthase [Lachnospiraceae bacterium]|nr:RluA family pseudouridine synthase [Lachnospiraceae bacterium]